MKIDRINQALMNPSLRKLDLSKMESMMLGCDRKIDIGVNHIFSGGVYLRQIDIPKGAWVMGKRHRYETCNILLKGKLIVYSEDDKPPVLIEGPAQFTTPPNTKKFAFCVEPAVFMNVLPTNETDPDKVEEIFIISEEEYQMKLQGENGEVKCLS